MKVRHTFFQTGFNRTLRLIVLAAMLAVFTNAHASQIDIPGPTGSGTFGDLITMLPNGNFVVSDYTYSIPSGAANVGAVYLYSSAQSALPTPS
jgi:hypothetical protein